MKSYELMSVYKTVANVEKEIKEAQNYLQYADQYYSQAKGRKSPTKAEYDYIRRMVDDGQPIVLTRKMKKALKIKDEMEQIDNAMKEDLKAAGFNNREIKAMTENEIDPSDEDSAERRKRKVLKEAAIQSGI